MGTDTESPDKVLAVDMDLSREPGLLRRVECHLSSRGPHMDRAAVHGGSPGWGPCLRMETGLRLGVVALATVTTHPEVMAQATPEGATASSVPSCQIKSRDVGSTSIE